MIDVTTIVAGVALVWTALQQMRINKICQDCPYFPPNKEKVLIELKRKKEDLEIIP